MSPTYRFCMASRCHSERYHCVKGNSDGWHVHLSDEYSFVMIVNVLLINFVGWVPLQIGQPKLP